MCVSRVPRWRGSAVYRCTSGTDEHSGSPALGIVQSPAEILSSHIDMDEHGLWLARCRVVAVRCRQRDNLEQAQHRPRDGLTQLNRASRAPPGLGMCRCQGFRKRHWTPWATSAWT